MKKFQYKMQSLLNIAYKMENLAKVEFANAQNRVEAEEEKLKELYVRKAAYEQRMRMALKESLDFKEVKLSKAGIEQMTEAISAQLLQVELARRKLEEARAKLKEAMAERKTHEKLREQEMESYMQEFNAEESKEIDQLVSYKYGRKIIENRNA